MTRKDAGEDFFMFPVESEVIYCGGGGGEEDRCRASPLHCFRLVAHRGHSPVSQCIASQTTRRNICKSAPSSIFEIHFVKQPYELILLFILKKKVNVLQKKLLTITADVP